MSDLTIEESFKEVVAALKLSEWSGGDDLCHPSGAWMGSCPDCSMLERDGHAVDCHLATALANAVKVVCKNSASPSKDKLYRVWDGVRFVDSVLPWISVDIGLPFVHDPEWGASNTEALAYRPGKGLLEFTFMNYFARDNRWSGALASESGVTHWLEITAPLVDSAHAQESRGNIGEKSCNPSIDSVD